MEKGFGEIKEFSASLGELIRLGFGIWVNLIRDASAMLKIFNQRCPNEAAAGYPS